MSPQARQQVCQELQLIERFSASYGQRFAQLIDKLNTAPDSQTAWQCLRLCAEAVDMMLTTHKHLAEALRDSADPSPTLPLPHAA